MKRACARFGLDRAVGKDLVIGSSRRIAADQARRPLRLVWRLQDRFDRFERRQMAGAIDVDRALVLSRGQFVSALRRPPLRSPRARRRPLRPTRPRSKASPRSRPKGSRVERIEAASFVSRSTRRIRTASANVTTAAQAATAPASAYKTPVLVGKRSTLAYPLAAAAISKIRLRTKIRIDIRPSMPTFSSKSQQVCGATREASKVGRFAFQ